MKKYLYLIIVACFYSLTSCAQNKLTQGISTIKNQKFEVTQSSMMFNNNTSWFIHPQKNKYKGAIPSPTDGYQFPMKVSDIHVDIDEIHEIVNSVLSNKKHELHEKGERFSMLFKFETTGILTDINYSLSQNTLITLKEIEEIDNKLREQIKARFTGQDYKHYQVVDYNLPRSITF